MSEFSHLDKKGKVRMVNVSDKLITHRSAVAYGEVVTSLSTLKKIKDNAISKGDVLAVSKIAAIIGAKKTSELIPLCHSIPLEEVDLRFDLSEDLPGIRIYAVVETDAKTGVEMEALTAVSIAALTIYDMTKSVERSVKISNIRLLEKHGGRSGDYVDERKP